jgi:hypothetical protein
VIAGATLITTGGVGYAAGKLWLQENLPALLQTQLRQTLQRDIQVGYVKSLSLSGIKFGPSVVPPQPNNPNSLIIPEIAVGFNLLPVLLTRKLGVDITLQRPTLSAQQMNQGEWITLELEKKEPEELPIDLDARIRLQEANIRLRPTGKTQAVALTVDGKVRYIQRRNQPRKYDAALQLADGEIKLNGQTDAKTGQTQMVTQVQHLALAPLAPLLPLSGATLTQGDLQADLKVDLPSSQTLPSVVGTVRLRQVQARLEQLKSTLKAQAQLRLQGKTAQIEASQAQLGDLTARLSGQVRWTDALEDSQVDLAAIVPRINLATLPKTLALQTLPPLAGILQAKLNVKGSLQQPRLRASLRSRTPMQLDQLSVAQLQADIAADPSQVRLTNFLLRPTVGGQIQGQGRATLPGKLAKLANLDLTRVPMVAQVRADLPTAIAAPYGLTGIQGNLQAQLDLSGSIQAPLLTARIDTAQPLQVDKVRVDQVQARVVADRSQVVLTQFQAKPSTGGRIQGQGRVALPANWAQLDPATLPVALQVQADLPADGIARAYGLPADVKLGTLLAQLRLDGTIANPQANLTWSAPRINGAALGPLAGRGRVVLADRRLQLQDTVVNLDGGNIVASGSSDLDTTQWQAAIRATNVDVSRLGLDALSGPRSAPLNAQLALSGRFDTLLQPEHPSLAITAHRLAVAWGEQQFQARGLVRLDQLPSSTWTAATDLEVATQADLARLPIKAVLQQTLPPSAGEVTIDPRGRAAFRGGLVGRNLLQDPFAAGNISLLGQLQVRNLGLNQVGFDPILAGPVTVRLGDEIAIDLRGSHDRLAARLESCPQPRCLLPYLPQHVDVRQGMNSPDPIVVTGQRQGDRFGLRLQNLNLAAFNLAPGTVVGVPGILAGRVNAAADVNLFTLATQGSAQVTQPGLGAIRANQFRTRFSYADGMAQIQESQLAFGQSLYAFAGGLDLKSGNLQGRLSATGAVQDLLALSRAYAAHTYLSETEPGEPVGAAALQTTPVGNPQAPLQDQIALWQQTIARLPQQQTVQQTPSWSPQLDLQGTYTGEVTLGGKLTNPQAEFRFEGKDWQWFPDSPTIARDRQNQLVVETGRQVPIQQVLAQGKFQDWALSIEPARLAVNDAVFNFEGQLSLAQLSGQFELRDFDLAQLRLVTTLPADVQGRLHLQGTLGGNVFNPQVEGKLTLQQPVLNGQSLAPITSTFRYDQARLDVAISETEALQLQASLPLAWTVSQTDDASLDVKFNTPALALLGPLTQNQITWVQGEGTAQFQARSRLNLFQGKIDALTAEGNIKFQDATLQAALLEEPLVLNGEINFNTDRLYTQNFEARFAQTPVVVAGVLPLFQPLAEADPDIDQPLTANLGPSPLRLKDLYRGDVKGKIQVTGSLIQPVIGGNLNLFNGNLGVPQMAKTPATSSEVGTTSLGVNQPQPMSTLAWRPRFQDFGLTLGPKFEARRYPWYDLRLGGDVAVNGPLDTLQPSGKIQLERGWIDALGTVFYLALDRPRRIEFIPTQGLFDPNLNLTFRTSVAETSTPVRQDRSGINQFFGAEHTSERREDIIPNLRPNEVEIYLTIRGSGSDLLSSLGVSERQTCKLEALPGDDIGLSSYSAVSAVDMNRLADCIHNQAKLAALQQQNRGTSQQGLLSSSVIRLTSIPPRGQSEIIALLGDQALSDLMKQSRLGRENELELLQYGATEMVLQPLARNLGQDLSYAVLAIGKSLGVNSLRVFPTVKASRRIGSRTFIDVEYDYTYGQGRILYRTTF